MQFYEDPSFFILLLIALVPAIILGVIERPLKRYGIIISWLFLAALFMNDWAGLALVAGYIVLTFGLSRLIQRHTVFDGEGTLQKKAPIPFLLCALCGCLAPLGIYKVTAAFGEGILGFIGISYITFRATQVALESFDGLIDHIPFFDYLYFLSFFPTFTSGPIDRSRRFFDDIDRKLPRWEYLDRLGRGILMVCVGLVMQLVLAALVKKYDTPAAFTLSKDLIPQIGTALITAYAYAAYLYFDFAGYCLMAQGVGLALGVDVPRNFKFPFISRSLQEFWDRWNITLSHWLRDFVFMRLERTMARHHVPKSRDMRASLGLVANMVLMGAWHGLTPTYLTYGLYHGVLLALEQYLHRHWHFWRTHKNTGVCKLISWFITLQLVVFGLAIFSGQLFVIWGGLHG